MTSTVLDVTVLLLCVSASVVTLGIAGGGPDAAETGYTADDAADRLTTQTATVAYSTSTPDTDSRTVHATLVELLSMAIAAEESENSKATDRFRSRAVTTVADALGPRTRVDVRHRFDEVESLNGATDSRPAPTRSGEQIAVVRGGTGDTEPTAVSTHDRQAIAVGPEPPTDAAVTVAVVTHPAPERVTRTEGENDRLQIVVRVW